MMSILTLTVMVLLVATMRRRPAGGARGQRAAKTGTGPVRLDTVKSTPRATDPGVVSYRLLNDKRLPSASKRAWRRLSRPFSWFQRRFAAPKPDPVQGVKRASADSVELQNFLDARNREIARRKSEGNSKPGPEDTLH